MKCERSLGLAPAMLLFASFLRLTTAQTATLDIPEGLPASCTPLATLLSDYPPPTDGRAVDDALNNGLDAYYTHYTHYQATATAKPITSINHASLCDFIISTAIPSASPSVTPALSSYISAAGIWLNDHGLEEAKSLHDGDCTQVVQDDDQMAIGDLDFVIAFGQCYDLLGWDKREVTAASSSASTSATTTGASSVPTTTTTTTPSGSSSVQATTSPTSSQSSEADASPPSSGSKRVADVFWILGATAGAILLLSL